MSIEQSAKIFEEKTHINADYFLCHIMTYMGMIENSEGWPVPPEGIMYGTENGKDICMTVSYCKNHVNIRGHKK